MITRRKFVQLSTAAGGTFAFKPLLFAAAVKSKPLRILILGGTGFTGPDQVRYAINRGHKVTVFNRGKTHPGTLPAGVEQLIGDRNGQLDALKGRQWDVVIDNPTTLPVWVRDAAQILKGNVERYVFISTISVYADTSKAVDENSPLAEYKGADPMKETMKNVVDSKFQLYGPLKALSEKEAEKWFPEKTLVVRPGLIVGPGDETDRFTYWPVRIDRDGEVLAPGERDDPVQFIDARDLAEWTIRMVENGETGVYNATGPAKQLGIGDMLDQIKAALNSNASFTWVSADFLEQQKVSAWSDMPVWIPPRGEEAYAARVNVERALRNGLTFRPLTETARDTLAWFKSQPLQRQAKLRAGLTAEREKEVLAAWQAREKK
jgi:2'-hydroxyisoflavone reductase